MKEFVFDFAGKNVEHDFARYLYERLNKLTETDTFTVFDSIHPDGLYDDLFGFLSNEKFINKFGKNINFILQNTSRLKESEPKVFQNFLTALEDTKKELEENEYLKKDGRTINFIYTVES